MTKFVDIFAGMSIGMIAFQLLLSLLGVPFDGRFLPLRTWCFDLEVTLQIVGLYCYCCFILMRMQYQSISYIWGVFCFIPFLIEICGVVSQCLLNGKYQLLDHK